MKDMLTLCADLPELTFGPGEVVVHEGGVSGALWILVEGALQVHKGGVAVNTITQPGAVIGEVSLLRGGNYSATVTAQQPSRLRHAADGRALLSRDAAITTLIAVGLAQRLDFVTAYLVDLKNQYGDAPGLSMVSDVLSQLATRQAPPARPGSAREPNPEH